MRTSDTPRAESSERYFWHELDLEAINTLGEAACGMLYIAHETGDPWPVVNALTAQRVAAEATPVAEAA